MPGGGGGGNRQDNRQRGNAAQLLEKYKSMALMTQQRIRHLPVVDQGQLKGIVSIGDLVKHRIDRIESEAEAMRAYIQSV